MKKSELAKKVDAFVNKYQGKTKGYPTDSYYQGECLSIVKLSMKEIQGFDPPPSGSNSAYGYWSNFPDPLGNYFERIPVNSNEKPFKGCIPIWNTNTGAGFGHIDIYLSGDNIWNGFDQNWGGRQAHTQEHNFNNVVGWLKPRIEEEGGEVVLKEQAYRDIRTALNGSYSEDEIKADLEMNKNLVDFVEGICTGDSKFKDKWIPECPEIPENPPSKPCFEPKGSLSILLYNLSKNFSQE